jgi:hypothetical protein
MGVVLPAEWLSGGRPRTLEGADGVRALVAVVRYRGAGALVGAVVGAVPSLAVGRQVEAAAEAAGDAEAPLAIVEAAAGSGAGQ